MSEVSATTNIDIILTGTKAATVGSVILCHHHSLRSQHFIYKWTPRSQHAQCIHWYSMENNSIYQRKWQGNANWTPSTLIWTTVFSILFRYFQNLWLKWVNPLNSRASLAALQTSMTSVFWNGQTHDFFGGRLRSQPGAVEVAMNVASRGLVRLVWLGPWPPKPK